MENDQIRKSIEVCGSARALARALDVSGPTVHQWLRCERPIPAERCIDIERATAGAVTCEELRPDLADRWSYLRGTQKRGA